MTWATTRAERQGFREWLAVKWWSSVWWTALAGVVFLSQVLTPWWFINPTKTIESRLWAAPYFTLTRSSLASDNDVSLVNVDQATFFGQLRRVKEVWFWGESRGAFPAATLVHFQGRENSKARRLYSYTGKVNGVLGYRLRNITVMGDGRLALVLERNWLEVAVFQFVVAVGGSALLVLIWNCLDRAAGFRYYRRRGYFPRRV